MSWTKNESFNVYGNVLSIKKPDTFGQSQTDLKKLLNWPSGLCGTNSLPFLKKFDIPEFIEILRSLYENKKALFAKVVKTSWYKRNEAYVSMDVPFDQGVAEADLIVYATTPELVKRVKKLVAEASRDRIAQRNKTVNDIVEKGVTSTVDDVRPSAPPQEQVEGC